MLKDYAGAERSCLRTLELKPTHGLAHYNLSLCLLHQGRRAEALDALRRALHFHPDLVVAHVKLAELLLHDGHVDEAISHLDRALRLDNRNDQARRLLEQAQSKKKS
jgi:tetratricopeptide (TPR) repeat protein